MFAEEEADLLLEVDADDASLTSLVDERVAGAPLEQVLGWADFHGQRVLIDKGVFVPRRRSEVLVDEAIAVTKPGDVVVDLCCGSGALGLAVAAEVPYVTLIAVDIDPTAVACALRNLRPIGATVSQGDLLDGLDPRLRGRIDVLIVNAPYVPTSEIEFMPAEARLHESRVALDGGVDGLEIHRRVASAAPVWLAPHGRLVTEVSRHQSDELVRVYERSRLNAVSHIREDCVVVVARQ